MSDCACEEVCPKATGNCRFKASAELPQPGVEYMEFSEPRGMWKVVRGPLTSDGPPFMGNALTCAVDEFSTLNLMSILEVMACGIAWIKAETQSHRQATLLRIEVHERRRWLNKRCCHLGGPALIL